MTGAAGYDRTVIIRASTEDDIAAIAEIYAHHVLTGTASFETDPPDTAEIAGRRRDVLARGLPYLVAEDSGAVAGYAYAAPYRTRPAYRFSLEDSIYMHPSCAGKGTGTRLLERLITLSEATGARQMVAIIGDSQNLPSIRLHEKFGFRYVGVLRSVGFKFGRWLDTVIMQRVLYSDAQAPNVDVGALSRG